MAQLFANNAKTTLLTAIASSGTTSVVVASGKGALFPNPSSPDFFLVTLDDGTNVEICKCTARSTDTLTVVRGQEGTTAQSSFAGGTKVESRATKETLDRLLGLRVQAVSSSSTVTPNADTDDMVVVTAQAAAVTFANPTGSPTQGQKLIIRVKDNGTARAISFGANYRAMGNALPTTTTISKTMYMGFIYNSTDTKWDLVAVAQEA